MSAGNTEENLDKAGGNEKHEPERTHSRSHSESSHHSHGSHHSHHSHSSRSSSGSHRHSRVKTDNKKKQSNNLSAEYEKRKKIKLWWRSVFIALICGGLIWLVIMIFTTGQDGGGWNKSLKPSQDANSEEVQAELDRLKTENMDLKYELEKYKAEYGELDSEDADASSEPTSSPGNDDR